MENVLMAHLFRTMGRLAGYAVRTKAFDKALSKTADFMQTEIRLADIKLKLSVLRRKRQNHLKLLGKTIYHLRANDIEPFDDTHTQTISRVLREIDMEIEETAELLETKKRQEQARKQSSQRKP